ncbi:hypothetical protein ACIRST_37220 [Kitasatospora sp. NPDC101447]|uniref:hypothetical protein n=1 Tax=Kitasatospora sp. NPDC101447 TaxID=3364102 RepID=UPI00382BC312
MRWLTLYARSRQVPASTAAVTLVALTVWALDRHGAGPMDLGLAVLILTANVAAASVGLGGPDVVLERTGAIRWVPRRAAHVLLVGAFAGAALLTVQAAGAKPAPTEVIVRDAAGLVGLAALGAALCGAHLAWTLPTGWLGFTLFVPTPNGTVGEVVNWMLFPPGTTASAWTAWVLLAIGTVGYAVAGPRR